MAVIFALQGRGNSGKSSTIKLIYRELIKKYPSAQIQDLAPGKTDIKIIISGIKGHIIGIESQGDPNSRLKQSLQDFCNAKCDIIFCATRSSGMTVKWVNSYANRYSINFIKQTLTKVNQAASNLAMAQNIISQAGL